MFEPLAGVGASLSGLDGWPTLADYNELLEPPIYTSSGARLSFAPQAGKPARMEDKYEARIYLRGEVQTRTENWHDLFNALAWLGFPRSKTALNARHFESISRSEGEGNRAKAQDSLTLFDESGVVVLYSDDELAQLLLDFKWKELFWLRRQSVYARMKFVVFGHSLHEKALKPYIGFTGKGLPIKVDEAFFSLSNEAQLGVLDGLIAERFSGNVPIDSRDLTPVPLLGIPGWWKDNEDGLFYANERYFRTSNKRDKRSS